jgi:hypothetical protein
VDEWPTIQPKRHKEPQVTGSASFQQ